MNEELGYSGMKPEYTYPTNSSTKMPNRNRIFISYSHKDRDWLHKFIEILSPDIRNDRLDSWDDRDIQPGDPWYAKIIEAISSARVAVLLVSPNFLVSRFIMEVELPQIIAAGDNGLTIIWIPLFGTFYGPGAPVQANQLAHFQAACDASKPLADLPPAEQTETLIDLCRRIQKIVNPGRVPWNLPFTSLAELFKGRGETMAKLDLNLKNNGSAAIVQPQVIQGLGGIGKTRLAIEYAWRHQSDYSAFLFVSANRPDDLDRNLAHLCAPDWGLDLPEQKSQNQIDQRDAVIRWLQQHTGWLLILDNVDTDEGVMAAKSLISKLRGGNVLITSRVTSWGRGVHTLSLDVLPLEDAVSLILESTKAWRELRPEDPAQARLLAENLGCLPLALTHATAYMEHLYQGFTDYLNDFERHFERLLAYHDHLAIEYETELENDRKEVSTTEEQIARKKLIKTVATTFFLSFDRLSPEAKAILQCSAFLSPDPIPVKMFDQCNEETLALSDLWCKEADETKTGKSVSEALAELGRYSLISRGEGLFSVHRMEQRILRSRVAAAEIPKWHDHTQKLLYSYAPSETAESPRTWEVWNIIQPHAEFLIQAYKANNSLPGHLKMMSAVGSLLFGKGLYEPSYQMDQEILKLVERTDGPESETMATKLLNFGESLRKMERPAEALDAFKRALKIREDLPDVNDLKIASVLNYVGLAQSDLKDKDEAKKSYSRAISIYESHEGEFDKDDFAKPLNNLAGMLWSEKDLEGAERLLSKAMELTTDDEKNPIKPQLAIICRSQLAGVLETMHNYERAEAIYKDILERLKVFPREHSFREETMERYIMFLCKIHKLTEARQLYTELIAIDRPKLGVDDRWKQPERRLRSKLRILESTVKIHSDGRNIGTPPPEILSELDYSDWKEWKPAKIYGITVKKSQDLNFEFIITTGDEEIPPDQKPQKYQELMRVFMASLAVDESQQWATSDGLIPDELIGSVLGSELIGQARLVSQFLYWAMDSQTPTGKLFRDKLLETAAEAWTIPAEYIVDVWIKPTGASVYSGEPVGDLAHEGNRDDTMATLLEASQQILWEWRNGSDSMNSRMDERLKNHLNKAFENLIVPALNKSLNEGRLLARIRQLNYSTFLALWFKEEYRYHPCFSKYLETGNPNQLNPSITAISKVGKNKDGKVQPEATFIEVPDLGKGIDLNNSAIEKRKAGLLDEAVRLHREALKWDEEKRGKSDPKIPHRLNNLSIALVMMNKLEEAKELTDRAWLLKSGSHDLTSMRILFVKLCIAFVKSEPTEKLIGRLKTLLCRDSVEDFASVNREWDIADFIGYLEGILGADKQQLVIALKNAIIVQSKVADLDGYAFWKEAVAEPLT